MSRSKSAQNVLDLEVKSFSFFKRCWGTYFKRCAREILSRASAMLWEILNRFSVRKCTCSFCRNHRLKIFKQMPQSRQASEISKFSAGFNAAFLESENRFSVQHSFDIAWWRHLIDFMSNNKSPHSCNGFSQFNCKLGTSLGTGKTRTYMPLQKRRQITCLKLQTHLSHF